MYSVAYYAHFLILSKETLQAINVPCCKKLECHSEEIFPLVNKLVTPVLPYTPNILQENFSVS